MVSTIAENGPITPEIVVSTEFAVPEETKTDVAEQKKEGEAAPGDIVETNVKDEADGEAEGITETIKVGMECDLKHLYQKEDDKGRTSWTDKYPEDLEEAPENETTARFAILVRNKKSFDSRKKLEIDSIVVQSPLLKQVLSKVLKDYPGVTAKLRRLVFQAPFSPFVHRWQELTAALKEQEDKETKNHIQLLYNTLEVELKDIIAARIDYIENKVITYEHLWTIFIPGSTLYSQEWNRDCGSRFRSSTYLEHPKYGKCFGVNAQKVDWDGDKFGYASAQNLILEFPGTIPISSLDTFPLEYHPQQEILTAELLKRGRLFEQYHGYHYKAYKSFAIGKNKCGDDIKVTVDSRIVIDSFAFGKFNPNRIAALTPLKAKIEAPTRASSDSDDSDVGSDDSYDSDEEDDSYSFANTNDSSNSKGYKPVPLTDEQLIQSTPLVRGYALKSKQWLSFFVDIVSEIEFNSSAFSNLVLPPDQKELILAIAESQVKFKDDFDDVISGKGKGIIMLLSGGPGIGKTLTAESVAETMKVPLYMMSAGDLGTRSYEVEANITNILEMVAKWNAVLLLDECDVFLEARSAHDLERNKIVSIFLRTLEYYEGILFLTTNRIQDMDPAFQSRIHISMEYPGLDKEARKQVWENFLKRGIENELSEKDIRLLADVDLNGRQIKNVLKTGQLLSRHKGVKLRYEHLRTVLNVERQKMEQI